MKLKKAMLLFAAAAVAAGTVAGCSGSAKETTAASVAETNAEETKEETTAEETQKEKTAAEEEDEENYDTGDAALDNTRNQDEIGEKELLVVSFGTSYNDSRRLTIGAIEDAIEKAEPSSYSLVASVIAWITALKSSSDVSNGSPTTTFSKESAFSAISFTRSVYSRPFIRWVG